MSGSQIIDKELRRLKDLTRERLFAILKKSVMRRHSQVVRQRSATPSSPVQIWLAPLKRDQNL